MNEQLDLVNFEQAQKLKQLGFDTETRRFFNLSKKERYGVMAQRNVAAAFISRPTVPLALKWLRDKKKIFVWICYEQYFLVRTDGAWYGQYKTYEEAESAGLDYALFDLSGLQNKNHE